MSNITAYNAMPASLNVTLFWSKVDVNQDACWLWLAGKNKKGYGRINIKGSVWLAHRISYWLYFGSYDTSLCLMHKCDNPSCVNPYHLTLGTKAENNQDMRTKGRAADQLGKNYVPTGEKHGRYTKPESTARGERNGSSKLTELQIKNIIESFKSGQLSQKDLANKFSVHVATINKIINNKSWKHIL